MSMSVWLSAALALGLAAPPDSGPAPAGVVFVVGGVGGLDALGPSAEWALPAAGVRHEVREFDWTHGKLRLLRDLQDLRHLLAKADELAALVRAVKAEAPDRPVYLVGHSAGAGLILAASERLPPATVERMVLLSPAVSPTFDLRPALRATRGEVVTFCSALDGFFLDWGTSTFGTVDRVYGPSAGKDGFREPDGLDAEGRALYRRLVQAPWDWSCLFDFRGWGHTSTSMPLFVYKHVAPWLMP
jgi:pimeloyl-ACP methyl ester carboxylesterase